MLKYITPLTRDLSNVEKIVDAAKHARVVMFGESTHGTEQFYQMRAAMSERLIEEHGFNLICVESDFSDIERVNRYVQLSNGAP
jgi:erythromycin esterase-like protein